MVAKILKNARQEGTMPAFVANMFDKPIGSDAARAVETSCYGERIPVLVAEIATNRNQLMYSH
jgi:hypothetical protein